MKILHVITSLQTGGAEKLMVDLLPRLRDMGDTIDLCVFNGARTPFYEQLENAGIRIIPFSARGSVYNPLHIYRLWKLMRKYDIVHTHNTAPQLFAAIGSVLCSVVLVTTEHTTSNRRRRWKWYACVDKWMYSRYQKVICISNQAETNLREYIKSAHERICTIFNGVDVNRFMNATPSEEIASEYKDKKTVAMVAGFRWEKDQDTLIKAFQNLPHDYHLLLVGDGVRRPECEELAKQMGVAARVHFLGLRTDVPNVLKAVDVVVMSSHFEGLSLSNVEGMASGNPFVASDVDGIREVTKDYGVLFPHGDSKALAEIVQKLCTDKEYADEIAAKCKERAMQYDIQKMTEGYNRLYHELMNKSVCQ